MAARALARHADSMTHTTRERREQILRDMLDQRRRTLVDEVHGGLRRVRADVSTRPLGSQDAVELADADLQDELRLTLIQMKAETLNKIVEALARLEEGRYGFCHECSGPIANGRLEALPFAVRCTSCETRHEARGVPESSVLRAHAFAIGW
jgi:DnaK suppressor protein